MDTHYRANGAPLWRVFRSARRIPGARRRPERSAEAQREGVAVAQVVAPQPLLAVPGQVSCPCLDRVAPVRKPVAQAQAEPPLDGALRLDEARLLAAARLAQ